ncbi:hypothetical protein AXK11_05990 [Cephaloticoccus primus]|uniref:EamA domain-containing protein n=1 Tax=Cephaloticoccus primus TaxID=1548207 RepID=A0A139SM32_9BACT|nr:EamA family transporter [Cephaloticoccus primus]KXU35540.1 hypothetical protein AXK11_05990 [Cephaloticoccus primus]
MFYLILTSLTWAFSFGLIKGQLTTLDPTAVVVLRLLFAALVFVPFLKLRRIPARQAWRLASIGALQFGIMYTLYLRAFAFLAAHEVVLFTIFTPVYVALLDAAIERRWQWRHFWAALLSIAGASVMLWHSLALAGIAAGFGLMQLSNLCFALGQLAWRRERARAPAGLRERELFGLLYLGALGASLAASLFSTDWPGFRPSAAQLGTIAYLGIIASGIGFFWWNLGALRVNAGTLAVMNNAKIPIGVLVSLLFFREQAAVPQLLLSGALMLSAVALAEGWLTKYRPRPPAAV